MRKRIKLLDVVALTQDVRRAGLRRGQVGTVVEELSRDTFEVEFTDNEGRTYACASLPEKSLIVLRYDPAHAV